MNENPQTILKFKAVNVKNISQIEIDTQGNPVVRVVGDNEVGKSSVIDSVAMLLGGADKIPGKPIREGASKANIIAHTQDYIIERVITNKSTTLHVKNADGSKPNLPPQALLDSMLNNIDFDDPIDFMRKKPKDQIETLKSLAGIDFSSLNIDRDNAYNKRTDENRKAVELKAQLEHTEFYQSADIPVEEISMESVLSELDMAEKINEEINKIKEKAIALKNDLKDHDFIIQQKEIGIKENEKQIILLNEQIAKLNDEALETVRKVDITTGEIEKGIGDLKQLIEPDIPAIKDKIKNVEIINRKVRSNLEYNSLRKKYTIALDKSDEFTGTICAINSQKKTMLENAKFPVPGLSFTDENVILNGIPFDQASTAAQLRVGVAIGLAMNPQLRVILIRDGSLLGEKSMKMLTEMIKDNDAQVWIEQVSNDDQVKIIIE